MATFLSPKDMTSRQINKQQQNNIHPTNSILPNHSLRAKVKQLIDTIIEYSAVCYFTGVPVVALIEQIISHHLHLIQDSQLQIITALIRSRNTRRETVNFIYYRLNYETLRLLQTICSTPGYIDCITRTKIVISILIGFAASPANNAFLPYSNYFPAHRNRLYVLLLRSNSHSTNEISHQHVTTATASTSGVTLDFSNLPVFSHMQSSSQPPRTPL